MSVETLKINESLPEAYPDAPDGLSTAAAALDGDMIWQRIEAYIVHRWSERSVIWTVQGGGDWDPPLTPVTVTQAYLWTGSNWAPIEVDFGPIGFLLPEGMSKIEAIAGSDEIPPAAVLEAFRRLAEYMAAEGGGVPGASRYASDIGGELSESFSRNPAFMARALDNSGAADLLRPYRRI